VPDSVFFGEVEFLVSQRMSSEADCEPNINPMGITAGTNSSIPRAWNSKEVGMEERVKKSRSRVQPGAALSRSSHRRRSQHASSSTSEIEPYRAWRLHNWFLGDYILVHNSARRFRGEYCMFRVGSSVKPSNSATVVLRQAPT
jgi:hypothetical protein